MEAIHRQHAAADAGVNKTDDSSSVKRAPTNVGLCERCVHARRIPSSRGSIFYLCGLSEVDGRFPRYPRLPVLECPGFCETEAPVAE
jgi:hypothetical protein